MHSSWRKILKEELKKDYYQELQSFITEQRVEGRNIFPPEKEVFSAFKMTPFESIKVVIIGQDPYHGEGQANGLSFSVGRDVRIPPSLRNIYKELAEDIDGFEIPSHGSLNSWAKQGVFLLNSVLTVEEALAASHKKKGWESFTDTVIEKINDHCEDVVFILWGNFAQQKGKSVCSKKHFVINGVHPSPLSASRGFFGQGYFSKANDFLKQKGKTPIDWQV